jgi:hypothetical protein
MISFPGGSPTLAQLKYNGTTSANGIEPIMQLVTNGNNGADARLQVQGSLEIVQAFGVVGPRMGLFYNASSQIGSNNPSLYANGQGFEMYVSPNITTDILELNIDIAGGNVGDDGNLNLLPTGNGSVNVNTLNVQGTITNLIPGSNGVNVGVDLIVDGIVVQNVGTAEQQVFSEDFQPYNGGLPKITVNATYDLPGESALLYTNLEEDPSYLPVINAASDGQSVNLSVIPGVKNKQVYQFFLALGSKPIRFIVDGAGNYVDVAGGETCRFVHTHPGNFWRYVGA